LQFGDAGYFEATLTEYTLLKDLITLQDGGFLALIESQSYYQSDLFIVKFDADGLLEDQFAQSGYFTFEGQYRLRNVAHKIFEQADSDLVIALSQYNANQELFNVVLKLTPEGVLQNQYSSDGFARIKNDLFNRNYGATQLNNHDIVFAGYSFDQSNRTLQFSSVLNDSDIDSDGVEDFQDIFPNDSTQWLDSDNDGVGDNSDAFINDASEWKDSDSDGVGDNSDAFVDDDSEWKDGDLDGIGDNEDTDDDNDGVSDIDEMSQGTDSNDADDYLDNITPIITAPVSITIAATDKDGVFSLQNELALFLNSASAYDKISGVITDINHDAPSTFSLGVTTVSFSAADAKGNIGVATAQVTVTDQHAPDLTLIGQSNTVINIGELYSELGAYAYDVIDGDLSERIIISGVVDVNNIGIYTLHYNVSDYSLNHASSITRFISVQDQFAPVINAPSNITVPAINETGTNNTDVSIIAFLNAATAMDDVDGLISVINHDAPDIFQLGVTTVTFSVMDSSGNLGQAQATINVVDQTAPVVNLLASSSMTITIGEVYAEPGFTAYDNVDGDIHNEVQVTGFINTATPGLYTLLYQLSDAAGNAAISKTRKISVQHAALPVIVAPLNISISAVNNDALDANHPEIYAFLNGATTSELLMDNINHDAPLTFVLGVTTVTFKVTDSLGNTGLAQAFISISDQTKPVIQLNGQVNLILELAEQYIELGATVTDNIDSSIVIITTGEINTDTVGLYTITYSASDAAGNSATKSRLISVQPLSNPQFMIPNHITVDAQSAAGTSSLQTDIVDFIEAVTVMDLEDGSELNITHNAPEYFVLGQTTITFSAIDADGNTGSAQGIVTVADLSAPVISLNGESQITITIGTQYIEQGVSVIDIVDGDISEQIQITNNINESLAGEYQVTYSVTDAANNSTSINRSVIIEAQTESSPSTKSGAINLGVLLLMLMFSGIYLKLSYRYPE
ncbi:MAG: DUF5011 domain-containing protein, partial [Saccharospirillaceae bacterium]|nr:DUF5011 domain-containing protein [Pseudomonadales bacterium]NRB80698.1 DUF5011 domain-containing protein [Saccharospirillaceae bacterium]